MFPGLSGIARNLRAVSAGSNADVRSLPLAEVAIASILAAGLWALQTRSWRATELHMKTVTHGVCKCLTHLREAIASPRRCTGLLNQGGRWGSIRGDCGAGG